MPELPEAETIRKELLKIIKGNKITSLTVLLPKLLRRSHSPRTLVRRVHNRTVVDVKRRGKALLFILDSADVLIIRLGMTGQLLWRCPGSPDCKDKHTHVIITFEGGGKVLFRDVRQFGELYLTKKEDVEKTLRMGIEPLQKDFSPKVLEMILSSPMKIKNLLMDQKKIAGIGNIYSDEILFEAGIYPLKPAFHLKKREIQRLHQAIGSVLREAITCKGDTVSDYRTPTGGKGSYQNFHRVYRRTGEPCRKCQVPIERVKIAGRSCHFCPACQT